MEFAKSIAVAPTAPTAPPSYEDSHQTHHTQHYQNESYQMQRPQSTYPHPQTNFQPNSYRHTQPSHPPYPSQPGNYQQSYGSPGQIVITQAPTSIIKPTDYSNSIPPLGHHPSMTRCLKCNTQIVTNVEYYNSNMTHCLAGVLCLTAWYCCCCFFPYCTNGTKSVRHYCPQCKTLIGSYDKKMC